jgi:hypothetical protein
MLSGRLFMGTTLPVNNTGCDALPLRCPRRRQMLGSPAKNAQNQNFPTIDALHKFPSQ